MVSATSVIRPLVVVLAAVTLVACGEPAESPPARNTPADRPPGVVAGVVHASPACAVEMVSDPCPDTPVVGATVELYRAGAVIANDQTDGRGRFRFTAPPGQAMVVVHTPSEIGSDAQRKVAVVSGRTTKVLLALDTGIR